MTCQGSLLASDSETPRPKADDNISHRFARMPRRAEAIKDGSCVAKEGLSAIKAHNA